MYLAHVVLTCLQTPRLYGTRCCPQWYYAATTLRSECTGAGQDLMLVAGPESVSSYVMEADSRRCHTVPSCKGHTGPCVSVQVSHSFLAP
jgi:hypothetical protein